MLFANPVDPSQAIRIHYQSPAGPASAYPRGDEGGMDGTLKILAAAALLAVGYVVGGFAMASVAPAAPVPVEVDGGIGGPVSKLGGGSPRGTTRSPASSASGPATTRPPASSSGSACRSPTRVTSASRPATCRRSASPATDPTTLAPAWDIPGRRIRASGVRPHDQRRSAAASSPPVFALLTMSATFALTDAPSVRRATLASSHGVTAAPLIPVCSASRIACSTASWDSMSSRASASGTGLQMTSPDARPIPRGHG